VIIKPYRWEAREVNVKIERREPSTSGESQRQDGKASDFEWRNCIGTSRISESGTKLELEEASLEISTYRGGNIMEGKEVRNT